MKGLSIILITLFFTLSSFGQEQRKIKSISTASMELFSAIGDNSGSFIGGGIDLGFLINKTSVGIGISKMFNGEITSQSIAPSLIVRQYFLTDKWMPNLFAGVGYGVNFSSPETIDHQLKLTYQAGAGVTYNFYKNFGLTFNIKYSHYDVESIISNANRNTHIIKYNGITTGLGFSYIL